MLEKNDYESILFYQPKFGCLRYSQTLTKLTQRRLCTGWVYRVALMV